jgi:hypothetical protein
MREMIEATTDPTLDKFNTNNLPPAGSEFVGKFFNKLWEKARKEKISKLALHQRWIDLHAQYRGKRRKQTYPRIGVNYLFKTVETYCATLTEKIPMAELSADNADDPTMVTALDQDLKLWWVNTNQQFLLSGSVKNMQIYGPTIEKGIWNAAYDRPEILLRDPFNIFPAPGYVMCDMDIPYFCDVDFLEGWQIKSMFELPEDTQIPSDADEQIAGKIRTTTRGGWPESTLAGEHYPTNYAPSMGPQEYQKSLEGKTLVVEIWIKDNSVTSNPIMSQKPVTDDQGRPLLDNNGKPQLEQIDTGQADEFYTYPDRIRKVTICPALLQNPDIKGVLDDCANPCINWQLLELRMQDLVRSGKPEPAVDPNTNQPIVDPQTGKQQIQMVPVQPDEAKTLVYHRAKLSFPLWGKFPYTIGASKIDTSQWWPFSAIEQLEELQGKAEMMLTKYLLAYERAMYPMLINPVGSGVENSEISNEPGLIIRPTIQTAPYIKFVEATPPPREYLSVIQFLMDSIDQVAMTPAVVQGQRPAGISAAAAIIALQDKASTLSSPQIQQVDQIIEWRGNTFIHFLMNFDMNPRQVVVNGKPMLFRGTDVFMQFKYKVESGSSAPITKAGRRQQYVELYKLGAMDLETMLTFLEIPQAKQIVERITEQKSLPGAMQVLSQAGVPPEILSQVYQIAMQSQFGPKLTGQTSAPTAEDVSSPAGGYSEGINAAKQGMQEVRE